MYQQDALDPTVFTYVEAVVDDTTVRHEFGHAVGISGTMLLVGSPYYNGDGDRLGVVNQFKYDGSSWQNLLGKLQPLGVNGRLQTAGSILHTILPFYMYSHLQH